MLVLNVYYRVKPRLRSDYIAAVVSAGIMEQSLKEPGCLKYEFYCPLNKENELLLIEHYVNNNAFEEHKDSMHFAKLQEIKPTYIESTRIDVMNID